MSKVPRILFFMLVAMIFVVPAYAQDNPGAAVPAYNWLASGIGLGIAVGLAGMGQGRIAAAACEGIARNPGAGAKIQLAMVFGLAFVESLVLFIWVMILIRAK